MAYRGCLMYLLVLGGWADAALGRMLDNPGRYVSVLNSSHYGVPQRCAEKTVTELPCSRVSEDRLLPHPDDCELFYYCVGEVAVCRQCPAELHFSPTEHVCERPARAGCLQNHSQSHEDD